jgi:hypothetical protein
MSCEKVSVLDSPNVIVGVSGANIVIAVFSWAPFNSVYMDLFLCFSSCTISVSIFRLIFDDQISPGFGLLVLVFHGVVSILCFSGAYYSGGYVCSENDELMDVLYFSVVTWTTLGYGDCSAKELHRLVAMMEGVFGYIYLGLVVSVAFSLMSRKI